MFKVGQKVVCVNTDMLPNRPDWAKWHDLDGLTKDQVYTVREIMPGYQNCWNDGPLDCIRVEEIRRSSRKSGHEVPFACFRFRPLEEQKTDISIFTAMLTPKKKTARA